MDKGSVRYYSDSRIDKFVNGLLLVLGFIMLTTPLWSLAYVHSLHVKLGIISASILFFQLVVFCLTTAKIPGVLAGTAAFVYLAMPLYSQSSFR